jgi:hypothetical protein
VCCVCVCVGGGGWNVLQGREVNICTLQQLQQAGACSTGRQSYQALVAAEDPPA